MADISKIKVNNTTYDLKDSRIPNLSGSTTTFLRGDGSWSTPTVNTMTSATDVSDEGSYLQISPASGGGSASVTVTPTLSLDGTTGKVTATVNETSGSVTVSGSSELQLTTFPGTIIDADQYSNVVPAGRYLLGEVRVNPIMMHYQHMGYDSVNTTSYSATDLTYTIPVTGTYDISWVGWRNNGSGTFGSQLYVNDSAYGSAYTSFAGNYGQNPHLTGVSLNKNDVIVVMAKSRGTSYYMYVANLVVQQTA